MCVELERTEPFILERKKRLSPVRVMVRGYMGDKKTKTI
jgi:hypothetical protein